MTFWKTFRKDVLLKKNIATLLRLYEDFGVSSFTSKTVP